MFADLGAITMFVFSDSRSWLAAGSPPPPTRTDDVMHVAPMGGMLRDDLSWLAAGGGTERPCPAQWRAAQFGNRPYS